jgi:hypothetical protein
VFALEVTFFLLSLHQQTSNPERLHSAIESFRSIRTRTAGRARV